MFTTTTTDRLTLWQMGTFTFSAYFNLFFFFLSVYLLDLNFWSCLFDWMFLVTVFCAGRQFC